jgi:hypothetical protein
MLQVHVYWSPNQFRSSERPVHSQFWLNPKFNQIQMTRKIYGRG